MKPFLPQKAYEIIRWVVSVVIPALITLYGTIAIVCHLPYTEVVLTIAGATETFLGTIFGINKIAYDKQNRCTLDDGFGGGRLGDADE